MPQDVGIYHFGTYRGGDTVQQIAVTFSGIDLTGASAKIEFREEPGSTVVLTLESGAGIALTASTVTIDPFPAPEPLVETGYSYDLKITAADGSVRTYLAGKLTVVPSITQLP